MKKDWSTVMANLSEQQETLAAEMDMLMKGLDDKSFITLLETLAVIEEGPAKMLMREAAIRLASKIGN
jgi:hypothetical protein